MGFISDVAGKVGNMFGFGGGMNQFNAQAPTNNFQAQGQGIDFATAVKNAMTGANGISTQQQSLVNALQSQAAGNGPSIAQPMLQQATDQNTQEAAGMIGSQKGMNAGLQGRQIAQQRAGIQQQGAQQMALLRNQEQLGAQGMLGHTLGVMGQQNLGMLGTAGHLGAQDWWNAQQLNQATAAQNAGLNLGAQEINAGVAKQNADISSKMWGGALNGLAGGLGKMAMGGGGAGGGGAGGADMLSQGGDAFAAMGAARGGEIPGRAAVPGDSAANDTVDAELSPGEIVLPRSISQSDNAPEMAAEFVRAIRRKHYAQGGLAGMAQGGQVPPSGYGKVLALTRQHEKRLADLESKLGSKKVGGKK